MSKTGVNLTPLSSLLWRYKKYIHDFKRSYIVGGPDKMKPRAVCCRPLVEHTDAKLRSQYVMR